MLGIENLKKLIKLALSLTEQISTALADGKITTMELFGFLPELAQIPGVVKSWADISAELKDLTPEERQELLEYINEEFDIPNDQLESFIENALMNAVSLISLVEQFKTLKNPAPKDIGSNPPPPPPPPPGH